METCFCMDHTRKACFTALPNLVTESQSMENHVISKEQTVTFGVLFCEETIYLFICLHKIIVISTLHTTMQFSNTILNRKSRKPTDSCVRYIGIDRLQNIFP